MHGPEQRLIQVGSALHQRTIFVTGDLQHLRMMARGSDTAPGFEARPIRLIFRLIHHRSLTFSRDQKAAPGPKSLLSATKHGVGVAALAARRGIGRAEITDGWRDW